MSSDDGHPAREPSGKTTYISKKTGSSGASPAAQLVHTLVIIEGNEPGRRVRIGAQPLTIGRYPPCALVLADPGVSRTHCQVSAQLDTALVTDFNSTNGTFVDGKTVAGAVELFNGGMLQVGRHVMRYESLTQAEAEHIEERDRDFAQAVEYANSLLPAPLRGRAVEADRLFVPSARLGGDLLGYHALGQDCFAMYLLDVSGHGAGAAMHGASITNMIRHQALPGTDFGKPDEVLSNLNAMFQMDDHGGMFFSMWYGVYDETSRTLDYSSAGHHPGYLVGPQRDGVVALQTRSVAIGTLRECEFRSERAHIAPGSTLYLFSDGILNVLTREQRPWSLRDILPLLTQPRLRGVGEPQRIYDAVRAQAQPGPLEDDVAILAVTFL